MDNNQNSIKVFVSSTLKEFSEERTAIQKAIRNLPLVKPVLFEDVPASGRTIPEIMQDEVSQSDIFIILLADRFSGSVQFEYSVARALNKPMLVFIRERSNPENELRTFIEQISASHIVTRFESPKDLSSKVQTALLDLLINNYRRFRLASSDFVEPTYKREIEASNEKVKPDDKLCFVIMPIGKQGTKEHKQFKAIFDSIIKPAVEIDDNGNPTGLKCERADELVRTGNIPRDIIEKLASAEIVIADLTTKNPNVFYELGVRHSLRQKTIMIVQSPEDIPFDVSNYRAIVYDPTVGLADESVQQIRSIVKTLLSSGNVKDSPVLDWI